MLSLPPSDESYGKVMFSVLSVHMGSGGTPVSGPRSFLGGRGTPSRVTGLAGGGGGYPSPFDTSECLLTPGW